MSVPLAYIGVIIIWSTTPLAVFWSSEDVGFMLGLTSRMVIAAVLATMAAALLGMGLKWSRMAVQLYLFTGITYFLSMLLIYWATQRIPTGWVSLVSGFMPIVTALMASRWLDAEPLSAPRLLGLTLSVLGLACIFSSSFDLDADAGFAIVAVLLGISLHAGNSVWIKRQAIDIPVVVMTSGGLLVAAILFMLTCFISGVEVAQQPSAKTAWSIVYLALFGSVVAFSLFYYVLKHVDATRTSLITLIAPVAALGLGNILNHEPLTVEVIAGAMLILGGLALFELGQHLPVFKRKY